MDPAAPDYAQYLKPHLHRLLKSVGLDVGYVRAQGDRLYYRDGEREVEVLDFLGGYGASLLGHNHPEVLEAARAALEARRPFHAQGSVRELAGHLARRLSERVERETGRRYVVTLASTGAEAVEAAIKHAELELQRRHERRLRKMQDDFRRLRVQVREGRLKVPPEILAGVPGGPDELLARAEERAAAALSTEPGFWAVAGGFHGKTLGALKLTHNEAFREPWRRIGPQRVTFLDPDDSEQLRRAAEAAVVRYVEPVAVRGELRLEERAAVNVAACFAEPVQGEGGIRELPAAYLKALRAVADEHGFPLVFDEIQCGLGRTGAFLASAASGVRADYYLFSKTLGGGVAKVSALLVDDARAVDDFSYLHTSTFADDDLSSAIGLKVLELLDRDGEALPRRCREVGERLLRGLRDVQQRYPGRIKEVRGRGLMIGVELTPPEDSPSPLLRGMCEQGYLAYAVAGYLLREHGIRVAPTLASHGTIRLEPSAYLEESSVVRLLQALESAVVLVERGDARALLGHGLGPGAGAHGNGNGDASPKVSRPPPAAPEGSTRAAFLVHFFEPTDLAAWDPSFAGCSPEQCARLLDRTRGLLRPFVSDRAGIRSSRGQWVDLSVIAVPFTTDQAVESLRSGTDFALEMVQEAVDLARSMGCQVVGLGGYTSIVSDDCRQLAEDRMALTSGNGLTAAAALEALLGAARARKLPLGSARLGIVGAAGNIGSAMAELAAEEVGELLLVGRKGSERFLEPVAAAVYAAELRRLSRGGRGGVAGSIAGTKTAQALLSRLEDPSAGEALRRGLLEELGEKAPIAISTQPESLRRCQLLVSATNSARPVVLPSHVDDGPVVVCDVAVPQDVDPELKVRRPEAVLLKGGIIRAPLQQSLQIAGMRLPDGELYACLAETLIIAMEGRRELSSYGALDAARVRAVRDLAATHGFQIEQKLG